MGLAPPTRPPNPYDRFVNNSPIFRMMVLLVFIACTFAGHDCTNVAAQQVDTKKRGPIALYDFAAASGPIVADQSKVGTPLNLRIKKPGHVARQKGSLTVLRHTIIRSDQPATKITKAIQASGELSIEAWVQPNNVDQNGPARVATLSATTVDRSFTLGQEADQYEVRFRTNKTDRNGIPATTSGSGTATTNLKHIAYVRQKDGTTRLFIDGKQVRTAKATGSLPWDDSFHFALANEMTGDRGWLGTFHLVAVYDQALTANEIAARHDRGAKTFRITKSPSKTTPVAQSSLGQSSLQRVANGLQVLYEFNAASGNTVRDTSGAGDPIHLKIDNPKNARRENGALRITGQALIRSGRPATRLIQAVKRSREISIEAWLTPDNKTQAGPARIVTLSSDSVNRNFTLGQEKDQYVVRLRSTATSDNGIPTTESPKVVKTKLTHVVYTRDRGGATRIYIDGKSVAQATVGGTLANWKDNFELAIGDELVGGRLWNGSIHLVAIYNRDLQNREVQQNFRAGPNATTSPREAQIVQSANANLFQHKIAPLLSKHCLECHDTATNQGGLNLARKKPAMGQSDNGQAIVAKRATDSLVWQSIQQDEMPHDRPPLSPDEKRIVKQWIDGGAEWAFDFIDPAIYSHGGRTNENWLQRLTVTEYIETVRAVLGVDISAEAKATLPADMRADGFSNTAYNLNVDLQHVDAYAKLARVAVSRLDTRAFAKRFRAKLSFTDKDMRGLISEMGPWILRGPLNEDEVVLYRGISTTVASAGGELDDAIGYVIQAMLQSPRFLYRIENQRGDGQAWQINDYELAVRMSYILWGAPPDQELYDTAKSGQLFDSQEIDTQVKRMLKDPRAVTRSMDFVSQWLNLGRMDNMRPDSKRFPKWNANLAQDMRTETLAFAKEVLWKQKRPIVNLLDAQVSFMTPALASHYGLGSKGKGLQRYDLSDVPSRGGLITQGSVLTVGGDDASMVTRGLLVMHELLRGVVKDPPPCVDTTPVPSEPGISQRMIAEGRIKNESCGGCHSKFEPLAFGLEKYDGLGSFHEVDEHKNRLREDGQILIPGQAKPSTYKTSGQLMSLLAESERVKESLTWKVTQFALGRPLLPEDAPVVARVHKQAQKNGGTYQAVISAIVASDLVQKTRTESE